MAREGPLNFGKPLLYLVILGCAGAGFYAYKNWPTNVQGTGWDIDFPNKWEVSNDPATPGKVIVNGPLKLEEHGSGVGWVTLHYRGAIILKSFVEEKTGYTLENPDESQDIGNKKAIIFEYEDQEGGFRFLGCGVDRGDAVVIAAIGCRKAFFLDNRAHFEKVVKSLRCTR